VSFINERYCKADEPLPDEKATSNEGGGDSAAAATAGGSIRVRESTKKRLQRVMMAYWDSNNLYGFGQSVALPVGEYAWMTREAIDAKDWTKFDEDSEMGYYQFSL
jgi:hypothetical protein